MNQAIVADVLSDSIRTVDRTSLSFDISRRALGRIDYTVRHAIQDAQRRVNQTCKELSRSKNALDNITLRIEQAPDEVSLADDFEKLAGFNKRINEAAAEVAVQRRELKANYTNAINIARSLRDKHRSLTERQESKLPIEYADRVRQLLRELRQTYAAQIIRRLEQEFGSAFRRLARKEDIVAEVLIDPRNFSVTLMNSEKVEVSRSHLSAGEKQIYAIAMLEALARTSGRRLPVVIDTPLGRLDSQHRENLVAHYFPNVSHQVLLLSTGTEIDKSLYQELSPQISHAYEIRYDEEENTAQLHEGYFWQAELRGIN